MGCCEKKKPEKLLDNNTSISESESSAEFDYKNKKLTYKDFKPLKLIGRGSFGEVLLVRMIMNNKLYAMKVLDKKILKSKKQQIHTKTERDLMVKINCPFIVDIKSAFQDEYKLYIVSEFLQGGDLFFHLHEKKKFSEDKAKFYSMELVLALDCLHKDNMIYRDLKPENVLLDSDGHIKLTDFGLSKIFETEDDKAFTVCGTPQYLAPEVLLRKGYNKSVDWWSFGCLLYEMLTGKLPFNIKKAKNLSINFYKQELNFYNMSEEAKDLIKKLFIFDPSLRLGSNNSDDIKNHKFFNNVNWDDVWNKKLQPPFIPKLKSDEDLKYFDSSFTDESIGSLLSKNSLKERQLSNDYNGFTYINPSIGKELTELSGDE